MNIEVKLGPQPRAGGGRFSSIDHAFRQGATAALQKLGLLEHTHDPASHLAKIYKTNNFGYSRDPMKAEPPSKATTPRVELTPRFSISPLFSTSTR